MVLRICKMIATSGFLAALECTNFVFGRGSAPDLAGGAYSALPDPLAGLRGPTSKMRGGEGEGKGKVHAESRRVVVHYIRNAAIAEYYPLGNAKRPINFLPSAKSLTTCLEDKSVKLVDLKSDKVGEPEQFQPRNKCQKYTLKRRVKYQQTAFWFYMKLHTCFLVSSGKSQHTRI